MPTPEISVIMPVYNTSRYLKIAIDSILNQSFENFELIAVDDGSTDGSSELLAYYKNKDNRIKLLKHKNSGLSISRNVALDIALGKYIYFMDSDDILNVDALMACYNKAEDNGLDLVFFDARILYEGNIELFRFDYNRKHFIDKFSIYKGSVLLRLLLDKKLFRTSPCIHFVKRKIIEDLTLRFMPGIIHEDELFIPQLYLFSDRVGYIPEDFFIRRVRANSIMTRKFSQDNINGYLTVLNELDKLKKGNSFQIQLTINMLIANITNSVAYQCSQLSFKDRLPVISYVLRNNFSGITFKNLIILLFPVTIKIKSIFKSQLSI